MSVELLQKFKAYPKKALMEAKKAHFDLISMAVSSPDAVVK